MKWKQDKYILEDRLGEQRKIFKFLTFPKLLDKEWRWLGTSLIVQEVCKIDVGGSMEWGNYAYKWRDIHWAKR